MTKKVFDITRVLIGVIAVAAVPYTVSAAMMGNEERRAEWEANREERQGMMEERRSEREANKEERVAERQEKFCENFTARMGEMQSRLTERKNKFTERKKNRINYLDERRDARDNMLTDKREEQDARRNAWYEKLEAAADTDEKKAAVAEFKKTVESAADTRREAVDAAISAFRKSVDAAVTTEKENRAGGIETFETIIEVALSQAKKDCADGKSPDAIRSAFQASLKSAREALQSERKGDGNLGVIIKDLATTRQAAMKSALDAFKTTLEQAKVDLKKAFGTEEVE